LAVGQTVVAVAASFAVAASLVAVAAGPLLLLVVAS